MTLEIIQGLLLAFALVVILMPPYIRFLRHLGFGKRIRVEGPEGHHVKEGTPTMGGLLVILVVARAVFPPPRRPGARDRRAAGGAGHRGLPGRGGRLSERPDGGRHPCPPEAHLAVGFGVFFAWQIQQTYGLTGFSVPVLGDVFVDPIVWVALSPSRSSPPRMA